MLETKKRIVEETMASGKIQYRVEEKSRFLSMFGDGWCTSTMHHLSQSGDIIASDAIFDTLVEAKIFCNIPLDSVVKREVLDL